VTAITALTPAIGASKRDMTFAVANVVTFGTMGMLIYPYVAHLMFEHSEQVSERGLIHCWPQQPSLKTAWLRLLAACSFRAVKLR
jgi:hypothetical protein